MEVVYLSKKRGVGEIFCNVYYKSKVKILSVEVDIVLFFFFISYKYRWLYISRSLILQKIFLFF